MAGRKKAEKPEDDAPAADNAATATSNDAGNDAGDGSAAPENVGSEGSKMDTATPAVAQASVTDGDEKATEKPEETTLPTDKPGTGLSDSQANAILETVLGTSSRPNLRRFVVLKPVRFNGKRIPRAGRVTVARAEHDELASLGAVSPVWDHGIPVETA
ncbi:MAG: hypothetical protein CMN25_19480 [Salinicola sp.]|nr:hypothetical protein [Salinicola sp.]